MKSRLLSLFIVLTLFTGVTPTSSNETKTFPCGGNATYSVSMPAGVVVENSGTRCSGGLILSENIKVIDNGAFQGSNLTTVVIPNSVTIIGERAFNFVYSLNRVIIPDSVTRIGYGAFANSGLETVKISRSVKVLENSIFYGTKLTEVEIPSSVTLIGYQAFYNVPLKSIVISSSVTSIEGFAFYGTQIKNVEIPTSVTQLGSGVFANSSLETVSLSPSLQQLPYSLFANTKLKTVSIPPTIKRIGELAFYNTGLSEVTIPDSVTNIYRNAFAANQFLAKVSIPDRVVMHQGDAFDRSYNLKVVEYCGQTIPGLSISTVCPPERQAKIDAAKAAAELKVKQEAEAKAKLEAELKAKQEAEAKVKAEAKAREELQNKAIESKCQEVSRSSAILKETVLKTISTYPRYVREFSTILQESVFFIPCPSQFDLERVQANFDKVVIKAQASVGKTTITCVKGKLTKKLSAVNPKCPKGYKKK